MSTLAEWARLVTWLHPSPEVLAVARYLESRGLRFLIEFGTENAVEKARELLAEEGGMIQ